MGRRDYVTDKILKFCSKNEEADGVHTAFMVMDDQAVDDFGRASFGFYAKIKGFFKVRACFNFSYPLSAIFQDIQK